MSVILYFFYKGEKSTKDNVIKKWTLSLTQLYKTDL